MDVTIAGASTGTQAFSFILLTVIFWVILELLVGSFLKDTSLPQLSILDNLGGVLVHLCVGLLVASLLFSAYGYGRSRPVHDIARFRRPFNQVLYLHYTAQSFWFPGSPPGLYTYDLNVR